MPGDERASDSQGHAADCREREEDESSKSGKGWRGIVPAWLDHFRARDLKILFRCWTATWVASILVYINPALQRIGLATFFGAILLYIVPPAGIPSIYLLAALSLLLGMCLAWAWGLLTMKAALAARPASKTLALLRALEQQAIERAQQTGESVEWEKQKLVYNGFMLDARVTAVFYVMSLIFIYAVSRLRYNNSKFSLLQIFGSIIMDLFLLIGPLLTSFDASLGGVLVKPGAVGIGLGTICCILLFPQSTSYVVLEKMETLIRMVETSLDSTRKHLANQTVKVDQLRAAKANMIATYKAAQPPLAFLPLDFSRGRWSADDVKELQGPVRLAMLACLSLIDFQIARIEAVWQGEKLELVTTTHEATEGVSADKDDGHIGRRQLQESADLMDAFKIPELGAMRERAMQGLQGTTHEVLQISSRAIELVARYIHTINTCRWISKPSAQRFDELAEELQDTLTRLCSARTACVTNTSEVVLESHASLFDESGQLKPDPYLRPPMLLQGIVMTMVIEEHVLDTARAIEKLLEHTLQLTETRKAQRFWIPSRLQYAISWLLNGKLAISASGTSNKAAEDPDTLLDPATLGQANEARRKLNNKQQATRRSFWTRTVAAAYKWLTSPSAIYSFRMVILTFATSIPAAIPHSAGFFYREKGIWAVITAQTCLLEYLADFTFSLVARGLGTVIGGVMGMVAWYMGSGHGLGNPYGMAASTALMTAILVWWRIYLPPAFAQAAIMSGSTFALVVGFSYDANHIQQYGLLGLGYQVFWKRLVTVLVGFVASIVVQLFPSPPSAVTHVRKVLANSMRALSDHYALLLSHWGRTEQNSPLGAAAGQVSLDVSETLLSLNGAIALLKIELSLGPFNQKVLRETQIQCQYMNQSLGRLLDLSTSLAKEMRDRLVDSASILDDRVIGDIMAVLGIIEKSLRTCSPLPERLPTPLIRRVVDSWYSRHPHPILSTTLVREENYRRYCVALSAYIKFLSTIDTLVLVLKDALGECYIVSC